MTNASNKYRASAQQSHTGKARRIALLGPSYVALSILSLPANAQSLDYASLEALFGEPVTTSVTGSPQRESEVPASMLIITAEQIRRSAARDIPGVLSHFVGIDVDRTSSEYADVAVHGYNQAFNPRLLVLVDGRQVYADYYGFTPWNSIPVELSAIRQIEVVKGPSGALFGFNAAGGVVNIVTYDALQDDAESTVSFRAGSQNLVELSAVSLLRFGDDVGLSISAGSRRSDEFSTPRQSADIGGDETNERNALSADGHFRIGPRLHTGVEATYSDSRQYEYAPTYTMTFGEYRAQSLRSYWHADTRFGLVSASIYRNEIHADAFLAEDTGPARQFDNAVQIAQIENVFKAGASHVLRIAAEVRDNSMETTPIRGAEVYYDVAALTTMWNWNVNSQLAWTNSIRLDVWDLGRSGYLPPEYVSDFGLSNEVWDIERDETSFHSGLVWDIDANNTIRFSTGLSRQVPNLLSLGGDFSEFGGFFFLGVPWLEPTNVSKSEIHWEHRLASSSASVEARIFSGSTEDIQAALFGNLGDSRTKGLEVRVLGSAGEHWQWDMNLLHQEIEDSLTSTFSAEMTLVDFENTTPERTVKGHLAWTRGPWEIDGYVVYQSDTQGIRGPAPGAFSGSFVDIPEHVRVDAQAAYEFSSGLRVSIVGRNVNRSHQRQTGAPEVERQIFATVQHVF